MLKNLSYYTFILAFIWFGLLAGISFLEAPVKFTAPSLTMQVGVDVGRHVFAALNKAELILAFLLVLGTLISKAKAASWLWMTALLILLLSQTFVMLPKLDKTAQQVIEGMPPAFTNLHTAYIASDILKLCCLFMLGILGIQQLRGRVLQEHHSRPSQAAE